MVPIRLKTELLKVDNELGLIMGYAIICTDAGEPYYDLQGDHIPESAMLEAATNFMKSSRMAKEMHEGDVAGTVVFAWPMTKDIATAFGISVEKTGLMIAMQPNEAMLKKFKEGTLSGFSIGGYIG